MANLISFLMATPLALCCDLGYYGSTPMMRFQQSAKIPVSSESAVHGERRNDFLAVVLSWPTDAIQLRSLITHPDAHSETHIHTVDARTHTNKNCAGA